MADDYSALGIGIGSTIYNSIQAEKNRDAQEGQNQRDRQQQEKMYRMQRDDARFDWAAQNAYNDPKQQMERLRQAGLSPHLVYGKGADVTAQSIRSYSGDAPNQPAPKFEYEAKANDLLTGYEMKFRQAQTDNVEADTALKSKEGNVKDATLINLLANTTMTNAQIRRFEELKESVLTKATLENEKLRADIDYTKHSDIRATTAQAQDILTKEVERAKSRQEIINLQKQLDILKNEEKVKEIEVQLRNDGLTPQSPLWQKKFMEYLKKWTKMKFPRKW